MREDDTLSFVEGYESYNPKTNKRLLVWASLAVHVVVVTAMVVVPLTQVGADLPEVESMAAFLARVPSTPPPPPPPPPPAAPASQPSPKRTARRAIVQNASFVAPVGIPDTIPADEFGAPDDGFAVGGVEGGVPGGVVGGIVGGLAETPPAKASEPARLDFRASEAKPSVRVEPVYPDLAREARVQGVVILEVLVDRTGAPEAINVLRSEALLEQAAVDAVGEWRWNPYEVAGRPAPFWVTVTVTFRLT